MSTPDDAPLVPDAVEDEAGAAPKRVSRKAKVWGWAGVALLVGVASWFGWQSAQQAVRWEDVGFKVVSPTEAQATFNVYLYKNEDAVCHLRALNSKFAEVGVADVKVNLADGREQRVTGTVVTTEEATTAVVKYCETAH